MAEAIYAPFTLNMAGLSEVTETTTDFLNDSSLKHFSINSRTSRPRSPIRAITFTSASEFLAIIPINVLFPTPLPAKIPNRCPLPQVNNPSITLSPVFIGSFIRFLFKGSGGELYIEQCPSVFIGSFPSIGSPKPPITRPRSPSPTPIVKGLPDAMTLLPGLIRSQGRQHEPLCL